MSKRVKRFGFGERSNVSCCGKKETESVEAPFLSIIVPEFNMIEKWFYEFYRSVETQAYQDWELCIIDNASTVPSLRPMLNQFVIRHPKVRLISNEEYKSTENIIETAFLQGKGQYLLFMNYIDIFSEDSLTGLFQIVEAAQFPDMLELNWSWNHKIKPYYYTEEALMWQTDGLRRNQFSSCPVLIKKMFLQNFFDKLEISRNQQLDATIFDALKEFTNFRITVPDVVVLRRMRVKNQ